MAKCSTPVLGILGAVASGKSTVAGLLARHGGVVIDADQIGHEVLEESEVKAALRRGFGEKIFGEDGTVNRKALAGEVFGNPAELSRLNSIVHPTIVRRIEEQIKNTRRMPHVPFIVLDAALLLETGLHERFCDALVFVEADCSACLQRAVEERGWQEQELERRQGSQMPLEAKKELADFVIDNSGTVQDLALAVERVLGDVLADCGGLGFWH